MRFANLAFLAAAFLAACGGDDFGNSVGSGTRTLLVDGEVSYEGGGAQMRVTVLRAGQPVLDASVTMESDLGLITLAHQGGGEYTGVQAGWGVGYALAVDAGDDSLRGSVDAPDPVRIESPDPTVAFDPHTVDGGLVHVVWAGDRATQARVKTKDFDMLLAPDEGEIDIPATFFQDDTQDIEIERRNLVDLGSGGGAPGSSLSAEYKDKVRVIVTNPF